MAWVFGAGFATGQEILQFFSSYGFWSYGAVLLVLIGFLFLGQVLVVSGYEHKSETSFNHFKYFCGDKIGTIYSWLIPVILLLMMPVLISGAGATISENFGIHRYIGSAIMVTVVVFTYLMGFERLIKIVSTIVPLIIAFPLIVGSIVIFQDFNNITEVYQYTPILSESQSSPNWVISSVIYSSFIFLSGGVYFTKLGLSADNRKDVKYGSILGAVILVLAILILNTSFLLNSGNITSYAVPVLYLTNKISVLLGGVFSIVLILGIFCSCSTMMWSVCSRFIKGGIRRNRIIAVMVGVLIFVLGMVPFSKLIGILYPLIGYAGLIFVACAIYKQIKHRGNAIK